MSEMEVDKFHAQIFDWWTSNKRRLPWRETIDPYKILVSEFMLQQTQVQRVLPKYDQFLLTFPTISSLATSSNKELLSTWSGLGYNRRAIWLKSIAQSIVEMGFFPTEPEELIQFKGIGPYTSRSIPIFAFNSNLAAIDVNIKRILIHFGYITLKTKNNQIERIAQNLVPQGRSRDWHNALMDYGSANLKQMKIHPSKSIQFKGSTRELRGNIIKLLMKKGSLNLSEIQDIINDQRVSEIISNLVREGLVIKKNQWYSL